MTQQLRVLVMFPYRHQFQKKKRKHIKYYLIKVIFKVNDMVLIDMIGTEESIIKLIMGISDDSA